ncbi:MAG: hypothetical protein HY329_12115 [Chloroflexi bacterium]|nr:hypothetical protein [Chloroflexota bacterium]
MGRRAIVATLVASILLAVLWIGTTERSGNGPGPLAPERAGGSVPTQTTRVTNAPSGSPRLERLTPEARRLVQEAPRVAFVVAHSHWDADWRETFDVYSEQAAHNIVAAIALAKRAPTFHYVLDQVVFLQRFWETRPEHRDDLVRLVRSGQLAIAGGMISQPDTNLPAPTIQLRNVQLGREWLRRTFGVEPAVAWQADAFGNAATLPQLLAHTGYRFLYIGRTPYPKNLPRVFHWVSPVDDTTSVLTVLTSYSNAYAKLRTHESAEAMVGELERLLGEEFGNAGGSRYVLLPIGDDFHDPLASLPELVERWNQTEYSRTGIAVVMADPETAFEVIAAQEVTQPNVLPRIAVDLNPLWQGHYNSRVFGKIADKESEYLLTAASKLAALRAVGDGTPYPRAELAQLWRAAAEGTHHDTITGASVDAVWESRLRPRFRRVLDGAAALLAGSVAGTAGGIAPSQPGVPVTVFNPLSWSRDDVIEATIALAGPPHALVVADRQGRLRPAQVLSTQPGPSGYEARIAFEARDVPAVGYATFYVRERREAAPGDGGAEAGDAVERPVQAEQRGETWTLANDLVSVTVDAERGGTLASLINRRAGRELLAGPGDDVTYYADDGNVWGSRFGDRLASQRDARARVTVLTAGPLLARLKIEVGEGEAGLAKTVTLRTGSALVEVATTLAARPQSTAVVEIPLSWAPAARTDDAVIGALTHVPPDRPITPGLVTYREALFYPITYWTDVADDREGLALLTHGLQGVAGRQTLRLMLVRQAINRGHDAYTENGQQTLRYALRPHVGPVGQARPWLDAYAFNQPLIPVVRNGAELTVELPFGGSGSPERVTVAGPGSARGSGDRAPTTPESGSLLTATGAIVTDVYPGESGWWATLVGYERGAAVAITTATGTTRSEAEAINTVRLPLSAPTVDEARIP